MAMKMSELVKQTDTSKSTILYYIKEGLLSEPQKPKPNLHLYDERCVEMIKFIKYLQTHFNASIDEIKSITKGGHLDLERGFETLLETLDLIMGSAHQSTYTTAYVLEQYHLTPQQLQSYLDNGLLFQREGAFSAKELEIVEILVSLERLNVPKKLLETYVAHARELAAFEVDLVHDMLRQSDNKNTMLKALFDTTLILKPYLFNMQTLRAYQEHKASS